MTRKQMMVQAAMAGSRAAQRGMPVRKNPFMEKTLFWMCWRDGWEEEKARMGGTSETL